MYNSWQGSPQPFYSIPLFMFGYPTVIVRMAFGLLFLSLCFQEHPVVSSEEERFLGVEGREVVSVTPTAKEINQGYQALHNSTNSLRYTAIYIS